MIQPSYFASLSILVCAMVFCRKPTEVTEPEVYLLTATIISASHKIIKNKVIVDSVPLSDFEDIYKHMHPNDTMRFQNGMVFMKAEKDSQQKYYAGFNYKEMTDSISLSPVAFYDSSFTQSVPFPIDTTITLKGNRKKIYAYFSEFDVYRNGINTARWRVMFGYPNFDATTKYGDSIVGNFCDIVYQ